MTFQKQIVCEKWLKEGIHQVTGVHALLGPPDGVGNQLLSLGSLGSLWVKVGSGHVRIVDHRKVYPFRKRHSPAGQAMITTFVGAFKEVAREKAEREARLRIETLTLTGVVTEIDSRIRSLKASYGDVVWDGSPNGDDIGSRVNALTDLRDWIKYRLSQG